MIFESRVIIFILIGLVQSFPTCNIFTNVENGEFKFCKDGICLEVNKISKFTNECTVKNNENACYFIIDKKIHFGVLNSDNMITSSKCDLDTILEEINPIQIEVKRKLDESKRFWSIRLSNFYDELSDYIYLGVIGALAHIVGCFSYLNCTAKQLRCPKTLHCIKKKGNTKKDEHNPQSQWLNANPYEKAANTHHPIYFVPSQSEQSFQQPGFAQQSGQHPLTIQKNTFMRYEQQNSHLNDEFSTDCSTIYNTRNSKRAAASAYESKRPTKRLYIDLNAAPVYEEPLDPTDQQINRNKKSKSCSCQGKCTNKTCGCFKDSRACNENCHPLSTKCTNPF